MGHILHTKIADRTSRQHRDSTTEVVDKTWTLTGLKDPKAIQMHSADPLFDLPDFAIEAYVDSVRNESHNSYANSKGDEELLSVATLFFQQFRQDKTSRKNVLVTNGAANGVAACAYALMNPGDAAVAPTPAYLLLAEAMHLFDGRYLGFTTNEENHYKTTPEQLRHAIREKNAMLAKESDTIPPPKVKFFLLINPNNPTGSIYTKEELTNLSKVLIEEDVLVVEDIVYSNIRNEKEVVSMASVPNMAERTITIYAPTKNTGGIDLRVGYVCGPEAVIGKMNKYIEHSLYAVSSVAQKVASTLLLAELKEDGPADIAIKEYLAGDPSSLASLIGQGNETEKIQDYLVENRQLLDRRMGNIGKYRQELQEYFSHNDEEYNFRKDLISLVIEGKTKFDSQIGDFGARSQNVIERFDDMLKGKEYLLQGIDGVEIVGNSDGGYFNILRFPGAYGKTLNDKSAPITSGHQFVDALYKASGVSMLPGEAAGFPSEAITARISYGKLLKTIPANNMYNTHDKNDCPQNNALIQALDKLHEFMGKLKKPEITLPQRKSQDLESSRSRL